MRDRLDEKLLCDFEQYGEECPDYDHRNQCSYELDSGVVPLITSAPVGVSP